MAAKNKIVFPYEKDKERLSTYEYNYNLFRGKHFKAFQIRMEDPNIMNKQYGQLKYVVANYAGLLSKVAADMLFTEPISVKVGEGGDQQFIDDLIRENGLNVQNYESALSCSYNGDALYKIRIGKRRSSDKKNTIIIEDTNPSVYFPQVNGGNVREIPDNQEIAWVVADGKEEYLRKEIHTPGKIINEAYKLEKGEIKEAVDVTTLPGEDETEAEIDTKVPYHLVTHIPNWRTNRTYFGISDYDDLDSVFFAINNRFTKTEGILDKHGDPILTVPEGVLDEKGQVKRERLHMIEVPMGEGRDAKPEYIVWDANLEASFLHLEKLIDVFFAVAEISPDALGMGKGQSDSGRALKYKLLRTIAKTRRKRLYYHLTLMEVLYVAQLLAIAHDVEVGGRKFKGKAVVPDLKWQDGLPQDDLEIIEQEKIKLEAGVTTRKYAIMAIENLDEKAAEERAKEAADEEKESLLPEIKMNFDPKNPKPEPSKNNPPAVK